MLCGLPGVDTGLVEKVFPRDARRRLPLRPARAERLHTRIKRVSFSFLALCVLGNDAFCQQLAANQERVRTSTMKRSPRYGHPVMFCLWTAAMAAIHDVSITQPFLPPHWRRVYSVAAPSTLQLSEVDSPCPAHVPTISP
jgi:hypothetical protein